MRTFELSWRNAILSSLAVFALLLTPPALNGQCTNIVSSFDPYPTDPVAIPDDNSSINITTCAYTGERSIATNIQSGKSYTVTGTGSAQYITITEVGSGTVVGHGAQPFTFTAPSGGDLYVYRHDDGACGATTSGCRTIAMTCNDCGVVGPTCDDGIQNGDETGVDCGGPDCFPCDPVGGNIPTMSEWGLIIFGLIMFTLSLVFGMSYQRTPAMAGSMRSSASQRSKFPFNQALYFKLLPYVYLAIVAIFGAAIVFTGYELTNADIPGSIIAGGILAYLAHFVLLTSKNDEE